MAFVTKKVLENSFLKTRVSIVIFSREQRKKQWLGPWESSRGGTFLGVVRYEKVNKYNLQWAS